MLRIIDWAIFAIARGMVAFPLAVLERKGQDTESIPDAAAARFRFFLGQDWKRWMEDYPEMATTVGYPGQNRRWTDLSPAGIARREKHLQESLDALKKIDRGALEASEQLN